MNTLGFAEALRCALYLPLSDGMTVAVASIAAQVALKIFAWADRGSWTDRDAVDLRTLVHAYSEEGRLEDLYAAERLGMLEVYEFEPRRAGAYWLGIDVRRELGEAVATQCAAAATADRDGRLRSPAAMRGRVTENLLLLEALLDGMLSPEAAPAPEGAELISM